MSKKTREKQRRVQRGREVDEGIYLDIGLVALLLSWCRNLNRKKLRGTNCIQTCRPLCTHHTLHSSKLFNSSTTLELLKYINKKKERKKRKRKEKRETNCSIQR
jgi:hypothetical protein